MNPAIAVWRFDRAWWRVPSAGSRRCWRSLRKLWRRGGIRLNMSGAELGYLVDHHRRGFGARDRGQDLVEVGAVVGVVDGVRLGFLPVEGLDQRRLTVVVTHQVAVEFGLLPDQFLPVGFGGVAAGFEVGQVD